MFFTIKLSLHLNGVLMLNWIVWNRTISIKMDLALNNLQRLICSNNQPNNQPNSFSNASVENCPSSTYLWLVAKRCRYRLTIPLQVWCMTVAVFWDDCFLRLPWFPAILRAILPSSMIKSSRVAFGDLISACRGSLCNLSIWRDLRFKIFHHVKTFFIKRAVSFLSTLSPDWVRSALYVFFRKHFEARRNPLSFYWLWSNGNFI